MNDCEDPFDDADVMITGETEEREEGQVQYGKSAHRCSMIKKYHTPAFFSPTKSRKVEAQTENPIMQRKQPPMLQALFTNTAAA